MKNLLNFFKKPLPNIILMCATIMLTMAGKTQGQTPLSVVVSSSTDSLCYENNGVMIIATIIGGTSPYTYTWSNGVANHPTTLYHGGTYWVIVTDAAGNTATASHTIYQDSQLIITTVTHNIPCHEVNTGSIAISVTGGTPPYSYHWNTVPPQNTQNAINLPAGTYTITVTDHLSYGCIETLTDTVGPPPLPTKQICYAGFDTLTFKNNVYLPANLTANTDSFHVYKEVSLNIWNLIGSIAAGSNHFTDINCNPAAQSYSYKIAAVDTCGNEGAKSNPHTTITLFASYDHGTDTYGFSWSAYAGLTVSNYYLYGITASGARTQIGSVPGDQYLYNYVHPDSVYIKYFVGFTSPDCNAKSGNLVKSNYVQTAEGIAENTMINNLVSLYPNPVTDNLQIQTDLQIKNIEITDITGRQLYTTNSKTIDCSNFAKGVYFIRVTIEKGVAVKKFVKE